MGTGQIVLVAAVVLIPLAIAVAVTLWTLEPAARRAERAKRARKPPAGSSPVARDEEGGSAADLTPSSPEPAATEEDRS